MAIVCPTVTCQNPDLHEYRSQMEKVEHLSNRIQVDLMDGDFAPTNSPSIDSIWFPEEMTIDLHLMYRHPSDALNTAMDLKPSLLIIHAEAKGDMQTLAESIKAADIRFGIALLKDSWPREHLDLLELADHVLVFSGDLGHFGGTADLSLLRKVEQIRRYRPDIEIGWDGGINASNIKQLADAGVDVLNVGGYIQNSDNPQLAYEELRDLVQS